MDNVKYISIQRIKDIVNTFNPKFKRYYQIKSNGKSAFVIFWCENCYRKYAVVFGNNDMAIQLISYLTNFLKKNNFIKSKEQKDNQIR